MQWGLWTHWESYLYVGLAPLVLAIIALGRVSRPPIAIWALVGLAGLIVSLGQYSPFDAFALLWLTPGLGWLRAPGRFELVPVLALAMLAAHGMTMLQNRARRNQANLPLVIRRLVLPAGLLAPYGLALLLSRMHDALLTAPEQSLSLIQNQYLSLPRDSKPVSADDVYRGFWATELSNPRVAGAVLGLFVVVGTLVAWQTAPWPRLRRSAGWPSVLVLATAVDLLVFGWGIHPRESLTALASPDPVVAALHQLMLTADPKASAGRVLGSPVVDQVAPDRLVSLGIADAGGYSSLDTSRQRALLQRVQRVDDDLLDLWGVRFVLDPAKYGVLNNYGSVDYFPRNPLVDATTGGDLADEVFQLPSPTVPREIRTVSALVGGGGVEEGTTVADITLQSATGEIIGQGALRAGVDSMDWSWDDLARTGSVRHARVEVAGEFADKLPDGNVVTRLLSFGRLALTGSREASTLELRSVTPYGRLVVYGVAVADRDGNVQQLFGRHKSKYRLIAGDQNVVALENIAAYPRAFLVQRARIAPPGQSLQMMDSQPFAPRDEVVVAADTPPPEVSASLAPVPGRAAHGPPGQADIVHYKPLEVLVNVQTSSLAFLVLTDTFYPGWHAYLDGSETPVLRGDLLFRVVAVPAGTHQIIFRFQPESVRIGVSMSLCAAVLSLAALLVDKGSQLGE